MEFFAGLFEGIFSNPFSGIRHGYNALVDPPPRPKVTPVTNKPKIEEKIVNLPTVDYTSKSLTKKASKYPNFNFETPKIKTYDLKSAGYELNTLKNQI